MYYHTFSTNFSPFFLFAFTYGFSIVVIIMFLLPYCRSSMLAYLVSIYFVFGKCRFLCVSSVSDS